ncbi:unnamed protein product [Meloidogyne enterolobii]|uniref:Uncharacterized protein n=1 Tax=Meloidogyne enterolobii TaxID=390850 RepID=A0ACB0ZVI5_MELEN
MIFIRSAFFFQSLALVSDRDASRVLLHAPPCLQVLLHASRYSSSSILLQTPPPFN